MFDTPAVAWSLTAVLLLGGSYNLLQATRSHQFTHRVNNALHALMHLVMAAMLWNLVPSTLLAQILFLAGAALWFLIQAIAHPGFKRLCAGRSGRMKCLYHSLTMLGAALMVAMMGHVTGASQGITTARGTSMSMPMSHHATATPSSVMSAGMTDHTSALAIPLTVLFGAAAAVFLLLLLRAQIAKRTRRETASVRHSAGAEHVIEALGAAVMAIMFGTMTA